MLRALLVTANGPTENRLAQRLEDMGVSVAMVANQDEARDAIRTDPPDFAIIDLDFRDGLALKLMEACDLPHTADALAITANPTLEGARQAMRLGCDDYFDKRKESERLHEAIDELVDDLQSDAGGPAEHTDHAFGHMVGQSPAMKKLFRQIKRVAPTTASVLLIGESGTGKELAARTIHERSDVAECEYITVNCGAIPSELVESEMFGHLKGSFTGANRNHKGVFERAHGGSLFLDEITELPLNLQVKLLRVLETGGYTPVGGEKEQFASVRVIAATNRDPQEAIAEGKLREDLYYRLAQFPLNLPPLRGRGEDVLLLADAILATLNDEADTHITLSDEARKHLLRHSWPGNVRELRNVMQRAHIMAVDEIQVDDMPTWQAAGEELPDGDYVRVSVGSSLADAERNLIFATLESQNGDKQAVADTLGISLKTLYNRLNRYRSEAAE